ncbi:MAG: hypothetical protein R2727_11425 [Bacteroidales bacterium]
MVAETGIGKCCLNLTPYLTPSPNRGKRNESAYVTDTAAKIASTCKPRPRDRGSNHNGERNKTA